MGHFRHVKLPETHSIGMHPDWIPQQRQYQWNQLTSHFFGGKGSACGAQENKVPYCFYSI